MSKVKPSFIGKGGDDCYDRLYGTSFSNGWGLSLPNWPFIGVKETKMLAPSVNKLVIYLKGDILSISKLTRKAKIGKKNKNAIFEVTDQRDWDNLERGSTKHHAFTTCAIIRNESFNGVLLCCGPKSFDKTTRLREMMAEEAALEGHTQRKLWGKKRLKNELVDLRTLLVHCAQAVANDNRLLASELLNKIRGHSSVDGDCTQRLAFYLVDGLEARLAGVESQVYRNLMARRTSSLSLAACPFDRTSFHFANQTILDVSQGQPRVHIVDFGISFGFQWPSLIQMFGQQNVRITGTFGQDVLNSIACEGAERTERPESYGQCQARCLEAGFKHLPVDSAILKTIVRMNKLLYHEEFFAVQDSGWLLQGWKGRVIYDISKWKPNGINDDQ